MLSNVTAKYFTPPEVARQLGVKPSKIIGFITREELRAIDVSERGSKRPRWRVSPDDLKAFLASRSNQKPAAPVARRRRARAPLVDYFPNKKVLVAK